MGPRRQGRLSLAQRHPCWAPAPWCTSPTPPCSVSAPSPGKGIKKNCEKKYAVLVLVVFLHLLLGLRQKVACVHKSTGEPDNGQRWKVDVTSVCRKVGPCNKYICSRKVGPSYHLAPFLATCHLPAGAPGSSGARCCSGRFGSSSWCSPWISWSSTRLAIILI